LITPGTGKSHTVIGLGSSPPTPDTKPATSPSRSRRNPLPRFGRQHRLQVIESLLRVGPIIFDELGFAPLDDTGTQVLFWLVAGNRGWTPAAAWREGWAAISEAARLLEAGTLGTVRNGALGPSRVQAHAGELSVS
jgi:hypothetical protein